METKRPVYYDFSEANKEWYFDRAGIMLAKARCPNIDVDETTISFVKDKVKVYVRKFDKKSVGREELKRLKSIPEYTSVYDRYMEWKKEDDRPIYEYGYLTMQARS